MEYSSGSDFDDDEDPDKIEVPGEFFTIISIPKKVEFLYGNINSEFANFKIRLGGGKDLATSAEFGKLNKTQSSSGGSVVNTIPNTIPKTSTSTTKLPTGLISKPNTTGFDIIKPSMGQGQGKLYSLLDKSNFSHTKFIKCCVSQHVCSRWIVVSFSFLVHSISN